MYRSHCPFSREPAAVPRAQGRWAVDCWLASCLWTGRGRGPSTDTRWRDAATGSPGTVTRVTIGSPGRVTLVTERSSPERVETVPGDPL